MKCSDDGLALIREFEGCELTAYRDAVGVLTIGVGHTGPDVKPGMTIDDPEADRLLREDVKDAEECVEDHVSVPLTQGQFDALVSFIFNLGCKAFSGSTLLQLLNSGETEKAAHQFPRWNKAGGQVLAGLTRRRKAEAERFCA